MTPTSDSPLSEPFEEDELRRVPQTCITELPGEPRGRHNTINCEWISEVDNDKALGEWNKCASSLIHFAHNNPPEIAKGLLWQ